MAKPNISLLGATYSGVAGVTLPKQGGGTATFSWVEGSLTITQNGTVDVTALAEVTVNVAGGGGGSLKYETGSFTLETDARYLETSGSGISHTLGVVPKCVIVWQTTYTNSNIPTVQVNAGFVFLDRIMDLDERLSSAAKTADSFYAAIAIAANSTGGASFANPTSQSYVPDVKPTSTEFYLPDCGANNRYRAGVSYRYFISEAWWT